MRKKSEKFKFFWSENVQTAFEELKVNLTSTPVLVYPDCDKPFLLCTDALRKEVGSILSQANKNARDHTVQYAIRTLSFAESNYSVFEREQLGIIHALKKFCHYLTSKKFILHTNQQALKHVFNMKDLQGRIAR